VLLTDFVRLFKEIVGETFADDDDEDEFMVVELVFADAEAKGKLDVDVLLVVDEED